MDERVMEIADAAGRGAIPSREDIAYLVSFSGYSPEAAYMSVRAREIAERAGHRLGLIHAQIGIDSHACAENCRFCTFAAINKTNALALTANTNGDAPSEVPIDDIVAYARVFDEAGVHLISLMATAGMPFDRVLAVVRAVRSAVSDEMPILVNVADMSFEEARTMRTAGVQAAYHAVRLGEGTLTDIDPDVRRATIRNIRKAGLSLMTGVEPLWEECDSNELVDRISEVVRMRPYCTGACAMSAAEGTACATYTPSPTARVRQIGSIIRLASGDAVPIGGVGGVVWVDAGADPRGRKYGSDPSAIARDVRRARRTLEQDEWIVPVRPSASWFAPGGLFAAS